MGIYIQHIPKYPPRNPVRSRLGRAGQSAANALQSKVEETQASIKAEADFFGWNNGDFDMPQVGTFFFAKNKALKVELLPFLW